LKEQSPGIKISHILHDIIPLLFPELVNKNLRDWFSSHYLSSIKERSSFLICNSRATAIDALNHNIVKESTEVYSSLLPLKYRNKETNAVSKKIHLNVKSYFLVIGSTDPRKNIAHTLYGFGIYKKILGLKCQDEFVLVGPRVWRTPDILQAWALTEKYGRIIETGYVDDHELHGLVKNALGVLMVSRYEGFGIPLALAKTYGIPVLTANNSSLPEASEGHGIYAIPWNPDDIALGLLELKNKAKNSSESLWNAFAFWKKIIELHLSIGC
ncbi:MAG: glycosyltransferase, partial [Silvanigrellaceae bacterium]|nr:glycosyltransferase [Silvanigrellaceae bacterium]